MKQVCIKFLWTLEEDGGVYVKAFGIDGKLEKSWPEEVFYECLLAICFYSRFVTEAKSLAQKAPEWKFLYRLRWHALSLAGYYLRTKSMIADARQLVTSEKEFNRVWNEYWNIVPHALDDVYSQAMDEKVTIYSLTRSTERWNKMKARMEKRSSFSGLRPSSNDR
jgi:hypothetical protein